MNGINKKCFSVPFRFNHLIFYSFDWPICIFYIRYFLFKFFPTKSDNINPESKSIGLIFLRTTNSYFK
ncbi:hypothetical protein RIR_jg23909.t1 [Rhizophagus irregularis DAOM 181602=DAOM 197198]|nr:hypothetical protein RIR_jg23909.t1 [Rhizophagus irregularis DAOM 181602=DAOM 197198]